MVLGFLHKKLNQYFSHKQNAVFFQLFFKFNTKMLRELFPEPINGVPFFNVKLVSVIKDFS